MAALVPFETTLKTHQLALTRVPMDTLQINVGKLCNQACLHCHVEAGPKRTEIMELDTVNRILELAKTGSAIRTIDVTGGAPELNPHFRHLVEIFRSREIEVIDRCNLTVFFEKGQEDTPQFLQKNRVKIVASLPCYTQELVDRQRGNGVFQQSIEALKILNKLGYGQADSGLTLDLVYNPVGTHLPPDQLELEAEYKEELNKAFGIHFNQLFTITNMPIKRFLRDLQRTGKYEEYMTLLLNSFNPDSATRVMCRNLISISWDGQIYDCDFNQMLEIPVGHKKRTIWDIHSLQELEQEPIAFASHCYGCTAGAGSSCTGSLAG